MSALLGRRRGDDGGELGQAADLEDGHQDRVRDQLNAVGVGGQGIDGGAVEVLHGAEIDKHRPVAAGGGGGQGQGEGVDIGQVDFPDATSTSFPSRPRAVSSVSGVVIR